MSDPTTAQDLFERDALAAATEGGFVPMRWEDAGLLLRWSYEEEAKEKSG